MASHTFSSLDPNGFKRFFGANPLKTPSVRVRGVGIREMMPACMIERPKGTIDYLIMLFHDSCQAFSKENAPQFHPAETMFIWKPHIPQYYGNSLKGFSHTWIHCDGNKITQIIRRSSIPVGIPFQISQPVTFQQCITHIHHELISTRKPDPIIVSNLLENAIRQIARSLGKSNNLPPHIPQGLFSVQKAISESFSKEWSLEELAQIAGMSVPHFCVKFREAFQLPPLHYIIRQRMQYATYLLSERSLTIKEIAERCGYCDPFHFSKMFKKYFGKTPKLMRERLR